MGQNRENKSIRATFEAKIGQNAVPEPSPDALFRPRARFLSILGSRPGPKIVPKPVPAKNSGGILAAKTCFFAFSLLRCVPEGSRSDSGGSGDPPGPDFDKIFHKALRFFGPDSCRILQYFFDGCVGILSGFVGFRRVSPGSTSNLSNPLAGVPLGYGDSRSGLNDIPSLTLTLL